MSAGVPPAEAVQVTTTVATRDDAERLAGALVSERLAACVQIVGPIRSVYRWRGAVESAEEWYCHAKTPTARLPALQTRLAELHPYEVPEIVALPIVAVHRPYLDWLVAETAADPTSS